MYIHMYKIRVYRQYFIKYIFLIIFNFFSSYERTRALWYKFILKNIYIYISYTISNDVQKHYTIYKTSYENIRRIKRQLSFFL